MNKLKLFILVSCAIFACVIFVCCGKVGGATKGNGGNVIENVTDLDDETRDDENKDDTGKGETPSLPDDEKNPEDTPSDEGGDWSPVIGGK